MKLISFIFCCLFTLSASANGFLPIANIIKIQGVAYINNEKIEVGAEVAKGMEIRIPRARDYVVIKFQNGHKVRLSGGLVKVEELTEKTSLLNLIRGEIHTLVKHLTEDEKFTIKTKYASFAVRGTKFGVSLDEKKKKAYLCVCEGVVNASQKNMSVDVKKDEDLWVGMNAKELKVKASTKAMFDQTNELINEMENL